MKRIFLSLIFIMIALAGVSCASASSDFNDTAVEFDHDIAPVNDDLGDVIVNNVSVNNVSVNDGADVSNVIVDDVVALNNQYMNFINPQQVKDHYYTESTRLNSTILHFGHDDIVIHSVKLRFIDSYYNYAVANVPVAFNTYYSNSSFDSEDMYNLFKNKPLDTYTTFGVTDKDGYVVFNYVVNPDPNIYSYCWFEPAEMHYKQFLCTLPIGIWQSKDNMVFSIDPNNKSFSIDMWMDNINGDFHMLLCILQ